jgi:hypothetical protein
MCINVCGYIACRTHRGGEDIEVYWVCMYKCGSICTDLYLYVCIFV